MKQLENGTLPCADCGVAVPVTADRPLIRVTSYGSEGDPQGVSPHAAEFSFGRCSPCRERLSMAQRLTEERPALRARLGDQRAVEAVDAVLMAHAVAGRDVPDPMDEPTLSSMLAHLRGGGLTWSGRFGPVTMRSARPGMACDQPWEHVSVADHMRLRVVWTQVEADERARAQVEPVRLAPPLVEEPRGRAVEGACLLCGVGWVEMDAAQVRSLGGAARAAEWVWFQRTMSPANLGAGMSPERLTGQVCMDCDGVLEEVGSVGPTALERAWARSTGRRISDMPWQVHGWGAQAFQQVQRGQVPEPNPRPWAHVPTPREP